MKIIALWNRKELYMGMSSHKFNEIINILIANGIEYRSKFKNLTPPLRVGSFGINAKSSFCYYIYVHKDDFDKAVYLVNRGNR